MTRTFTNPRFFAAITVLFAAATWLNLATSAEGPGTSLVLNHTLEAPAEIAGNVAR